MNCKDDNVFFVGIDLSFTGTGVVVLDGNATIVQQELISTKSSQETEVRILEIFDKLSFVPEMCNLESVYIEGLSYASKGQAILELGALHYFIRIFLYQKTVNYKVIPPGTLKKFITGKGNAKKNLMLMKVYKRWGVEFDDDNLCDAYSLARMSYEDFKDEKS